MVTAFFIQCSLLDVSCVCGKIESMNIIFVYTNWNGEGPVLGWLERIGN